MADKPKVPKPKGLKSSLKGIPPVALIGIPVLAGVAFWLYSRKNRAATTTTAQTETSAVPATGSAGSGFGGYGYSDPYSLQNSVSSLAGAGSTTPTPAVVGTNDYGQQVTPQITQMIPDIGLTPPVQVLPYIPIGGHVTDPVITPLPSTTTPTPAETFIPAPVKVTPSVTPPGILTGLGQGGDQGPGRTPTPAVVAPYVAPALVAGKAYNPVNMIPRGYTSADYAATRAARLAAAAGRK